jgi:uncharacterized protein (TIGR03083 family)
MTPETNDTAAPILSDTVRAQLEALRGSAEQLAALVEPLTPDELRRGAYPTEWTVADVLSHLGSGAVITRANIDGDPDMQAVWDEWNAKTPEAQAADVVVADRALLDRLSELTGGDEATLRFAMGPMELDLTTYLGMRLNEHALHTWDVDVTVNPSATVPEAATALIVDTLPMISRFGGKPTGSTRTITVRTSDPTRHLAVTLGPDGAAVAFTDPVDQPDLELPADALIRLVYGRLDPDHTPTVVGARDDLDELRRAFPGF